MRKLLVISSCFFFIGMSNILAQAELPKHSLELGTEISYIKYVEPDVMEEKGMMYGIVGACTYRSKFMLKADGRFSYGQVDYKNSGTLDNIDDYILEFRGLGGYDFSVLTASTLTPYIGIGYRYLNDDMSGKISSTGAWGYERESNYLYSPVGIEVAIPLKNKWIMGATTEYDIFWRGKQISHLGDAPGYTNVSNRQNKGYGIRGSVKFQKKGEKLDFVIEPFIRYWNIKDSEKKSEGYEPKNNSKEIGLKLAVKF